MIFLMRYLVLTTHCFISYDLSSGTVHSNERFCIVFEVHAIYNISTNENKPSFELAIKRIFDLQNNVNIQLGY